MTVEELDLARAKEIFKARYYPNDFVPIPWVMEAARANRLGDEARGLRVVPVEATEEMIHGGACSVEHPTVRMGGPHPGAKLRARRIWDTMLAASPFAPEPEEKG